MDHIHTHYALKEFKYLVSVFGEVLEKQVLENTVLVWANIFKLQK